MPDTVDSTRERRRRSDARRSIDAILAVAGTLLGERPDATMNDIARAAGLSRQTVYAHFASRDALAAALVEAARTEGLAALREARLDTAAPIEALTRFLDISWQLVLRNPVLLDPSLNRLPRPDGTDSHDSVAPILQRIIRRGQRAGEFDRTLPASWLATTIFAIGHAAADEVAAGRLSIRKAAAVLLQSSLRLCGAVVSDTRQV